MLIQFVASPIQGALSDRFGRRPVILLSNLAWAWTSSSWRWRSRCRGCSSAA